MLRRVKIGVRLVAGFGILLSFLVVGLGAGLTALYRSYHYTEIIVVNDQAATDAADRLHDLSADTLAVLLAATQAGSPDSGQALTRVRANDQETEEVLLRLHALAASNQTRKQLEQIRQARVVFQAAQERVGEQLLGGHREEAAKLITQELLPQFNQLRVATSACSSARHEQLKADDAAASVNYSNTFMILCALGAAAIGIGIAGAFLITRSILRPLLEANRLLDGFAEGDFTQEVESRSRDEVGDLVRALGRMGVHLRQMLLEVRGHTDSVAVASGQLTQVSAHVSRNSETTAGESREAAGSAAEVSQTLASVATATEELSSSVKEIAQQTANASKVAETAVQ